MLSLSSSSSSPSLPSPSPSLLPTAFIAAFLFFGTFPLSHALQNLFPKQLFQLPTALSIGGQQPSGKELETKLIDAISENNARLSNSEEISSLVKKLEAMYGKESIQNPAVAPEIYGKWRLLYTSNAGTSSPIQRSAVNTEKFPIYQDIVFNDAGQLLVKQIVQFSDNAELSVDALASTSAYPLEELVTPRETTGKVLGLNLLGVSFVGDEAEPDPSKPNSRIDFVFDEGNFLLGNNLRIPYPVPFRLPILRDWVKGWIDITWLSSRVRISRGNKGTTFVLIKEENEGMK